MRIVVVGAGVVGLATAYYLARDGHAVTVVDRNDGVALETSFANGAQLSYSYVAPLAGPGVLPKVPPWLLRRDSPLRFYPALDAAQWRWLLGFVAACNREQSEITTRRLLALAGDSRKRMHAFVRDEAIDFDYARNGKLVVYSDAAGFDGARRLLDYQRSLGSEQVALDRAACLEREPSLAVAESTLGRRLVGGIDTPSEEVGDCYRFCVGLARRLVQPDLGVRMQLGTLTRSLVVRDGHVTHADTADGDLEADAFVVAAGVESMMLCRDVGVKLPLYPLKGYSLTLPVQGPAPAMSITDFKRKVVYAPLADGKGQRLRVAGMADIAGWSREPDPVRLRQLLAEACAAFPRAADYATPIDRFEPWCGLRPATPLGSPLLGATRLRNLFVNVGQGALGWTLALASGGFVADVIARRPTAIAGDGLTLPAAA